MGSRIAAWSLSGVQNDAWRIHSSLALPVDQVVTALDNKSGAVYSCLFGSHADSVPRLTGGWDELWFIRIHLDSGKRPSNVVTEMGYAVRQHPYSFPHTIYLYLQNTFALPDAVLTLTYAHGYCFICKSLLIRK